MKTYTVLTAVWFITGCALSGQALIEDISACDLTDTAICKWEYQAERGVNLAIDMADNRLCVDFVTKCPESGGTLRTVPCPPQTCQSEPGAGDRKRGTVDVIIQ